ncbi:hypothetical protein BZL39_G06510 [Zygosaccharomyces parabailii]|nr:hypothetical protein BZL39_G06510 [Zygosaccharomyces parabailii]
MTQKEYSDTLSRNSIPHRHDSNPQLRYGCIAGVQLNDNDSPDIQRGDGRVHTGEVPNGVKTSAFIWIRGSGRALLLTHLFSLVAYGYFGLSSGEEDNHSSVFVYGGSLITAVSYLVLYCTDVNKLSSSIFENGEKEGTGIRCAKVGVMGIILPAFNFIGLIVLFKKVGQDHKTFWSGITAFISYLLGNAFLLLKKGKKSEFEEHKLGENKPPVDKPPADNSQATNSSADNSPVDNSLVDNSPAANSPVDNPSADNSPRASIRTFP